MLDNDFHDAVGISFLQDPSIISTVSGSSRSTNVGEKYTFPISVLSKPIVKCKHSKCIIALTFSGFFSGSRRNGFLNVLQRLTRMPNAFSDMKVGS